MNVVLDVSLNVKVNVNPNTTKAETVGKTTKNPVLKAKWKRISSERDFKTSHTPETEFRASDRTYVVTADGSWRKKGK